MNPERPIVPGSVRFQIEPDSPTPDGNRHRWRARYAHAGGWAPFEIHLNLGDGSCTVFRVGGTDYRHLRSDLARALLGDRSPPPAVDEPVARLTLAAVVVGQRMARDGEDVTERSGEDALAASFRPDPTGDWLVVQVFVPSESAYFYLAVSDRLGAGEILVDRADAGPAVFRTLARVFG